MSIVHTGRLRAARHVTKAFGFAVILATGCASTLDGDQSTVDGGGRRDVAQTDTADAGRDVPYFDTRVYDVYLEDACPGGRPPARREYTCDALTGTGCDRNETCRPYIEYPTVSCGSEVYRTRCFPNGTVQVGGFCQAGNDCAPGSSCFVTGAMNRCLRLCSPTGSEPSCPRGSVCEPTDLPDFGACQ